MPNQTHAQSHHPLAEKALVTAMSVSRLQTSFLPSCGICAILISLLIGSPAAWARQTSTSQSQPEASPERTQVKVYTDIHQFLQSRVDKLRRIVKRAQAAQQNLRKTHPRKLPAPELKALRQWQSIEQRAQNMLVDIQNELATITPGTQGTPGQSTPPASSQAQPTPMAKNALLTRLDGKQERIAAHRGDVVLLHFWATWCRPCVKEMDTLEFIYKRFRNQELSVIAVSLDARRKDVRRFLRRNGLNMPVYMDPGRTLYQEMIGGIEVLPRSLLIDKTGRIVRRYAGARHLESPGIVADIKRLLASRVPIARSR